MRTSVTRYLDAFWVTIKNNWVREAVYRTNFITSFITDLVWILVEFSLFAIIYANTESLGGWTQPQVYFFLGFFFAADALFTIFFQRNFWMFSDLVNRGELDILLTKPISAAFLALTRYVGLTSFLNFGLGLAIMIRYSGPAEFAGGIHWLEVPIWFGVSVAVATAVRFLFSVSTFWTERSWALAQLYYHFFQFASKPDTIFPKAIRYLVLTALPFALIGSVPSRALLQGLSLGEYALVAGVLGTFVGLDVLLWRAGLRRYQSASS